MQHATIFGRLPGLNEYVRANRGNKYSGAKMKKEADELCGMCIRHLKPQAGPVRIQFVWYEKELRRDLDNVAFAKKFILDSLVRRGVLKDDSPKWVIATSDELRRGTEYKVDIYILEVGHDETGPEGTGIHL